MKPPTRATLARYGMVLFDWWELYEDQSGRCPVCERPLEKSVIDHLHATNWRKMAPEKRRLYVRSLVCRACNHWLLSPEHHGFKPQHFIRAGEYLAKHRDRIQALLPPKAQPKSKHV